MSQKRTIFSDDDWHIYNGGKLASGSGYIPFEDYAIRQSSSEIYMPEDFMKNYQRSVLKDTGCDKPWLASDEPRRNVQAKQRINLRLYGQTSEFFPDHPEMFLGELAPDLRGHADEPDLKGAIPQSLQRVQYKDLLTADPVLDETSGMRTDERLIRDKNQMRILEQSRIKVFDTSLDSRPVEWGFGFATKGSRVPTSIFGGEVRDTTHLGVNVRRDATTQLSNLTKIGGRTTTDHKFKVSSYGMNPGAGKMCNVTKSNQGADISQLPKREIEAKIAKLILTYNSAKDSRMRADISSQIELLSESLKACNRTAPTATSEVGEMFRESLESQSRDEIGYHSSNPTYRQDKDLKTAMLSSLYNHSIYEGLTESAPNKFIQSSTSTLQRDSIYTHQTPDDIKHLVYKTPITVVSSSLMSDTSYEHLAKEADLTPIRKSATVQSSIGRNLVETDYVKGSNHQTFTYGTKKRRSDMSGLQYTAIMDQESFGYTR